jgi:probable blue pigment (indigoidine) exporter
MNRHADTLLTALAPAIWGTTYLVTTEWLPDGYPLTVATLRALPAGLLLLFMVRKLPMGLWWLKAFLLGGLNIALFWWLLFFSAYRLPGGVAATVTSIQPLLVIFLARGFLGTPIRVLAVIATMSGMVGVGLLILTPEAALDTSGLIAGVGSAVCMATGTILTRLWRPPVSLLTLTAWQLSAGGLLLAPVALWLEPALPALSTENLLGLLYLGLIGAAFTYVIWFRGVMRLEPSMLAVLGFFSPLTAVLLGWWVLDQHLSVLQSIGVVIVLGSIWFSRTGGRVYSLKSSKATASCEASP